MLRTTILLVLVLLSSVTGYAQPITFQKLIGGSSSTDYVADVLVTPDSGIVVLGGTGSYGAGNFDIYLVKLNKNGSVLWTKTYGGSKGDSPGRIAQTADSGFIIIGSSVSFNISLDDDLLLLKTNKVGDVQWSRVLTVSPQSIYGGSVIQTADGGFLVGGDILSTDKLLITKLDSTGATVWTKTYGEHNGHTDILQTADGGFMVLGDTFFNNSLPDNYLMKIDSLGNILWTRRYERRTGRSLIPTRDGGYLITGYGVMKSDSIGNIAWERYYWDLDAVQTIQVDSGYIVIGEPPITSSFTGIVVTRINQIGDVLWSKVYEANATGFAVSVVQALDGGFFIGGMNFNVLGDPGDIYVIKTDSSGESGCNTNVYHLTDTALVADTVSFSPPVNTTQDTFRLVTPTTLEHPHERQQSSY